MGDWTIKMSERPLGVANHRVILVYDDKGNFQRRYEGLAYDGNGTPKAIGSYVLGDKLRAYTDSSMSPNALTNPVEIYSGTASEVQTRIQAMDRAVDLINSKDIPYQLPIIEALNPANSNSVISTLLQVADLKASTGVGNILNLMGADGGQTLLLSPRQIADLRRQYGIVDPPMDIRPHGQNCFLAGTMIRMADGSEKPIEQIEVGDEVASFDPNYKDGLGPLKPGIVSRTFQNITRVILDIHGLKITPGHTCLSDKGDWLTIADILRQDRAMVRQVGDKAIVIRARTGSYLDAATDTIIHTTFVDPATGKTREAEVRGGITFALERDENTQVMAYHPISLAVTLYQSGNLSPEAWQKSREIKTMNDIAIKSVAWPQGLTPFTYDHNGNWIVSLDGQPFTPEWIRNIPRDGEETRAIMNAGGSADDMLIISPTMVRTMKIENGQNVFNPVVPTNRGSEVPARPVNNNNMWMQNHAGLRTVPTQNRTPQKHTFLNRSERRKQSAMLRVVK